MLRLVTGVFNYGPLAGVVKHGGEGRRRGMGEEGHSTTEGPRGKGERKLVGSAGCRPLTMRFLPGVGMGGPTVALRPAAVPLPAAVALGAMGLTLGGGGGSAITYTPGRRTLGPAGAAGSSAAAAASSAAAAAGTAAVATVVPPAFAAAAASPEMPAVIPVVLSAAATAAPGLPGVPVADAMATVG